MSNDTEQNQEQQNLETNNTENEKVLTPEVKQETEGGKLRKMYEAERKAKEALKKQLEQKHQEELDKQKSLEEKYLEEQKRRQELENKLNQTSLLNKFEKRLYSENINPEFADLLTIKATNQLEGEDSIDMIIEDLRTTYPTAFTNQAKPMGKVGLSANGSNAGEMSKLEIAKKLLDPNTPITAELDELAKKHGI